MRLLVLLTLLGALNGAPVPGETCSLAHDCNTPYQICNNGICSHKSLFPMIITDGISPVLLMVGIALSNAAGIGGGGISLPILLALLGFSQLEAVSIANFLMFVGAFARILVAWREKHPLFPHKLAVNYDFIIILLPLALVGTLIGVLINQVFPEIILSMSTVLLFLFLIYKSLIKGLNLRKIEKQFFQKMARPLIKNVPQESTGLFISRSTSGTQYNSQEGIDLIQKEGSHWQPKKQILILTVMIALVTLTLLRGDGTSSVILRCSALDWIAQFAFLLICVLAVVIAGCLLSKETKIRNEVGLRSDVNWNKPTIIKLASFSISIGLISGSLGLGGGVVITPLLFSIGQPPSVASLTSVYIIFFTSLSDVIQFIAIGSLNYQYALFNGAFVLLGSIVGLWLISRWVLRSNKQSFLVFLLAFVILAALCSEVVFEAVKASNQLRQNKDIWEFKSVCPA